jgi:PAS domain S-box-containing protein
LAKTMKDQAISEQVGTAVAATTLSNLSHSRQAEIALRESEERLRLLAQATTDALYDWDIARGITSWNHGMRTLFGYPVDSEQTHNWWQEHVHPQDRERTIASVYKALADREQFWSAEYRYLRADNSYAHVIDRGYLLYDEAGAPTHMIGAMIDVTDRVQLAEAQTRAALEERQRLARDLHDSVTQSLYSLTLLAEAARRWTAAGNLEQVQTHLGRLGETAQQSLKEMRLLVYELRPAALEKDGLLGALQQRLDAVEKRAGIDGRLRVEGSGEVPLHMEEALYRITQEALNNALKYAAASKVTVVLTTAVDQIKLQISDNGKGFDPDQVNGRGGLGLVSISERVERLNGDLVISSQPGTGTTLTVTVRVKRET